MELTILAIDPVVANQAVGTMLLLLGVIVFLFLVFFIIGVLGRD